MRCQAFDRFVWAGMVTLAPLITGCDITGEYERRFAATLQSSGQRAIFEQLLDKAEVDVKDAAGQPVGVKLRIPAVIDANKKELPATDPLAQPPFVKLPGLG